jgi:hypothetical protein
MIDVTRPIYRDGEYVMVHKDNGHLCAVNESIDPEAWEELQGLIAAGDVTVGEGLPAEELAAAQRAAIIAELNALDVSAIQYIRATMEGTIDKEGSKRYEANKKRVKELKAELQTLNQE